MKYVPIYFEDQFYLMINFIYSEKATKFCEIFTLLFTGTAWDKSKVKISQNFVAFAEYMNFKLKWEAEDIVSKIRVSLEVNTKYFLI